MLALTNPGTADKVSLITSTTAPIDVHVSHMDVTVASPPIPDQPGRTVAAITTATTTDIAAGPASGRVRNVKTIHARNKSATLSNDVTVQVNVSAGTLYELFKVTLAPGDVLEYVEGIGFFVVESQSSSVVGTNYATASTSAGFATDTYLANTAIKLDALGSPTVGRRYSFRLIISKTAAGTVAPVLTVRVGTNGTTGDTGRLTFTWGAGTAAVDRGEIELEVLVTTAGASGIVKGKANFTTNLTTTGLSNAVKALVVTSSAFDLTVANSIIGLSWNGGTSAVHTVEWQTAFTDQL